MRNMRNRDCKERMRALTPMWRVAFGLMAIAVAWLLPQAPAQMTTTTVQGTVYRADGTAAAGTLLVSWPAFTTPQNQAVAAGSMSTTIGADGFVSLNLTPNANALPTGSYYTAVYHLNDGTVNQEYWVVPASASASIASVRAELEPSTVAVQSVSKAYVDSAISSLNGSWLPLAGGTMTGPLNLNNDPASTNQAATKHYADQLAAAQLPLSGGTVTGALNAKQIEGQLYAEQWQTGPSSNDGIAMSIAECTALPYACQVLAPATYAQTEAQPWGGTLAAQATLQNIGPPSTAPMGATITDFRFGPAQTIVTPGNPGDNRHQIGPTYVLNSTQSPGSYLANYTAPGLTVIKNLFAGSHSFNLEQTNNTGLSVILNQYSPASTNALSVINQNQSNGDSILPYFWNQTRGGINSGDNEGNEGRTWQGEATDVFQGTINSMSTTPANSQVCGVTPCWTFATKQTQGAQGSAASDLAMTDQTHADSTGYITNINNNVVTASSGADWDTRYGDSNAWGTISQDITDTGNTNVFPEQNVTVTINVTSGTPTTVLPVCLFDNSGTHWECEPVTAASATSITFSVVRRKYASGSWWSQGGMAGMGFTMQADWVGPGAPFGGGGTGLAGFGTQSGNPSNIIRPTYPIMYNVSGNTATMYEGNRAGFSGYSTRGYSSMGSGGTVTATVSGGSVTSCTASGGTGYNGWTGPGYLVSPPQLTYTVNTGATSPVLYITTTGAGGSLTGCAVQNGGSGITSIAVAVTPTNPYAVYPMTHIFNAWNPATGAVDGSSLATDAPMPNGAAYFQAGNTVEVPHYYAQQYTEMNGQINAYQGHMSGRSQYFGGNFGGNDYGWWLMNTNQPSLYTSYPASPTPWVVGQGMMGTPYGYTLSGSWHNGLWMKMPPYSAGGLTGALVVGCFDYVNNINVCSKWTPPYNMVVAQNANNSGNAEDTLQYSIPTTTWSLTAGATQAGGLNPYCTETLAGNASGGFSVTCNGKTSKLDTSGNFSLPGFVRAQGGVTGATINGEFTVDGTAYTTLNAAWNAAVSQANATGQNQTVRLGPGNFPVTATLSEPTNGSCVSLTGSGAPTVTANSANASTVISVPSGLSGDLFSLQNTAGSQAQSCTFRDLMVLANKNANHAFNFQWFRGLYVDDVTVNDTIQDAFYLGEASGSHQANFEMRNVSVSYSSASFAPASRPNYGLNLQTTVLDSFVENLLVRNALQAAVYNAGGGTTFELVHGFGYPYTCTTDPCNNSTETNAAAADASWATNYEVVDAGSGGNMYSNTYMDSPAIAAFDLKSNGVQINGGHIQWPDTTSFPNATFAEVESTVSSNLVISNVDCLNMSATAGIPGSPAGATGVWISYMGANGSAPTYSAVSNLAGCGQYVQQRVASRQTAFDMAGNNSSNTNYGTGQAGTTPKVFVTPLSTQGNEGGVEVENFSGGQGDSFYSGFSGQASNFAVMADGTVRHTGLQTSAVFATSSTTLTKANHVVLANASSGAFTVTLPSCYTPMPDGLTPTGMEFTIVKTDTTGNAVQLATTSGETMTVAGSKATSYSIAAAGGLTLACGPDSNWYSTEQIAAAAPSSGVASFNGRTGTVTPASGDYSFSQIGGQATNAQLPASLTAATTGNAATATALAAAPAQCPAGYYSTGIGANGNANCSQTWHFTWYGYFGGTFGSSTNNSLGSIWSPSAAISMTRLDIAVGTAPAGCSTWPVIGIYDSTAASWLKTVTLATSTYSYRNAVTGVSIPAGHNLSMGVQTAGAGCTTSPGSAQLTMEYTMNQ